ncbi:MAG: sulfite exporter TauE/SafE family protein [Verrucomicrobia bacterium]|nr:sulfite exporter TauE/SafE family protein [Verrucomicrobiota bacterium]
MTNFSDLLAQGNAWLYLPAAVALGALHGLEPGHSKTMMAAFIVAVRGTVGQAVLLGVAATLSHTALIWALAFVGLHYSGKFAAEDVEPYLQVATGVIVIGLALWMLWRVRRAQGGGGHGPHGGPLLRTAEGFVEVSVFEDGVPPRFRLYFFDEARLAQAPPVGAAITCETIRAGGEGMGVEQNFHFEAHGAYLEATEELPEPHEFHLVLHLRHGGAVETCETRFVEEHDHAHGHDHHGGHSPDHDGGHDHHGGHSHDHDAGHDHDGGHTHSHDLADEDAHSRAHAREWQERFAGRPVTTWQIFLFGLTGGLMPCPSAFAVLLVCLQLKQFALGFALVLAFSVGLALTLVTVGALAALSVKHATRRFAGLHKLAARMPYASAAVMLIIGALVAIQGARAILH